MADNVDIIVQDTINEIVVNATVVVETIDINVQVAVDEVTIIANPNDYIINVNRIIGEQVQSDWNVTDDQAPDYIKNKPTIPSIEGLATVIYVDQQDALKVDKVVGKGLSANDFTDTLKTKLDGIQDGAEVNVNADWNATSGDAEILNKPTIPAAVTKTSDLTNDGADGVNPFITLNDIPPSITPNLQSVTDEGNTTTNQIIVESGQYKNSVGIADVRTENTTSGASIYLSTDDGIVISNASGSGRIKADNIALGNNPDFQLPNKSGTFTIATIDDIPAGGLTSVGLTMPAAFSVANSPLTSDGTIAVTAAGTSAQYIRGDGQLATLPSSGGGGASVFYYLNGSIAASVATYKQLSNTAVIGVGTDFAITGNGLITQFLTDVGNPNRLQIPSGTWNFEMFFSMSSSGGTPKFYVELLKYNGATFTTIANNSAVPETITGGTSIDLYLTSLAVPTTTLLSTDRLAIRVYVVNNSGGRTATLHTEDNHLCEIITTFSGGVTSLNGLTANTQYLSVGTSGTDFNINSVSETHTFNLPTASATNRGALSTTDWSVFNAKQNALTNPITGTGTTNYLPKFTGTSALGNSLISESTNLININSASILLDNNRFLRGKFVDGTVKDIIGINDGNEIVVTSVGAFHFTNIANVYIDGTAVPTFNLSNSAGALGQLILESGATGNINIRGNGGTRLMILSQNGQMAVAKGNVSLLAQQTIYPYDATIKGQVIKGFTGQTANLQEWQNSIGTVLAAVTAAGNVGIGTTAPAARLHVAAPGALSTDLAFKIRNSADSIDLIKVNGLGQTSIGQGTATLTNMLTVQDVFSTSVAIEFRSDQNPRLGSTFNTSRILSGYSSGTSSFLDLQYAGGAYPYTYTTGLRLNSAGNVGIGTTAPTSKLQVVGLVDYATNALAIAGGLTVGAFYHTAGVVKVVI